MSVFAGPEIVNDGLVFAFDAANKKSYSGSGTTWTDLSGNGNNSTLTNGPTYNSGDGGSIVFDGVNDFANTPSPTLNLSNFTFNSFVNGSGVIFGSGVQETWPRYFIFQHNLFRFRPTQIVGDGINYSITIPSPVTDKWNMISYVRNGSTMYAFQNGTLANTYVSFPTNNLVTYADWGQFIGKVKRDYIQYTSETFFTGSIAQVSIYNRALSATEIQQNFNALRGRFGI